LLSLAEIHEKHLNISALLSHLIYCMEIWYSDKMATISAHKTLSEESPTKNLDYFIIVFFFAARKIRNFQFSLFIVYFLKSTQFIAIAFKLLVFYIISPSEFSLKCYCLLIAFSKPANSRNKLRWKLPPCYTCLVTHKQKKIKITRTHFT
jgi:hypothetical protein